VSEPRGSDAFDATLARERTTLAWDRTGAAFLISGAAALRLLDHLTDVARLLYGGFIVTVGLAVSLYGHARRGRAAAEALPPSSRPLLMIAIANGIIAAGALLIAVA
jgi:uncharacterized membrane protein YidH (DUF202 family)